MKNANKFVCTDCVKLQKCKEPFFSWVLFFIALVAVISIRAVNVLMDVNPVMAKIFWYTGIVGFLIFFAYKFQYDTALQKELASTRLSDKLLSKNALLEHDYHVLATIVCKLSSKKDAINYFFIFFFSGIALALAIYVDFIKPA